MVYFLVGIFIALDFLTGVLKSFKEKNYTSTIMREGLYHKVGSVLCVLLGYIVDYTQVFLDIGVTIPVTTAICVYIVLMEIGSIIENISILNPEIVPTIIQSYFGKLNENQKRGE